MEELEKRKPGRPKTKAWDEAPANGARESRAVHNDTIHEMRDDRTEPVHETEDEPWVNPASLPYIKPRPGMVQRYIRVAIRGETDATNTARKFREGWVPRRADSVPGRVPVPKVEGGKYAGCIGVEGMILCEMPIARNDARNAYFAKRNKMQSDAVDKRLAEESAHKSTAFGPVQQQKESKFVREVAIAADE